MTESKKTCLIVDDDALIAQYLAIHARMNKRIIFVTGSSEGRTIARIHEDDPYKILIKPIMPDQLHRAMTA